MSRARKGQRGLDRAKVNARDKRAHRERLARTRADVAFKGAIGAHVAEVCARKFAKDDALHVGEARDA